MELLDWLGYFGIYRCDRASYPSDSISRVGNAHLTVTTTLATLEINIWQNLAEVLFLTFHRLLFLS
ncbi:MAG TPA: hypothetical protein V6C95_19550 [Coleofasciculaceae cyanobacterium]